eukprot:Lithocolla_globosa_v1_NODE_10049_length_639_cov_13.400685.p2 type:complete len:101 gc:universal NODE_10049_length_639_cov_13.400685:87-389(+)
MPNNAPDLTFASFSRASANSNTSVPGEADSVSATRREAASTMSFVPRPATTTRLAAVLLTANLPSKELLFVPASPVKWSVTLMPWRRNKPGNDKQNNLPA